MGFPGCTMCTEIDLSNNDIKESTFHVRNKAGESQGKMNHLEKFSIVKKIWLSNNKLRAAEFTNVGFDGKPCFSNLKLCLFLRLSCRLCRS